MGQFPLSLESIQLSLSVKVLAAVRIKELGSGAVSRRRSDVGGAAMTVKTPVTQSPALLLANSSDLPGMS